MPKNLLGGEGRETEDESIEYVLHSSNFQFFSVALEADGPGPRTILLF